jgi:hypothetical protein
MRWGLCLYCTIIYLYAFLALKSLMVRSRNLVTRALSSSLISCMASNFFRSSLSFIETVSSFSNASLETPKASAIFLSASAGGILLGYPDTSGNVISYDDNCNMTNQIDKGILQIDYNILDHSSYIKFSYRLFSKNAVFQTIIFRISGLSLR